MLLAMRSCETQKYVQTSEHLSSRGCTFSADLRGKDLGMECGNCRQKTADLMSSRLKLACRHAPPLGGERWLASLKAEGWMRISIIYPIDTK